jgi:hypothetical protein
MVFFIALVLFIVVMGYLDSRLYWPKPKERAYVSVRERSKTLKRD